MQGEIFSQDSQPSDPQAAVLLAQQAVGARSAGEFKLAAKQWEQLIKDYPQYSQLAKAHFNAGVCYVQIEDFKPAIGHFENAIATLSKDQTVLLPQSYLYLGFSQSRLGREFSTTNPDESQKLLTTATETLATLLRLYPSFVDNDQAYFFQGESFENLGRLDKAEESYAKILEFEKPAFKLDGLFALGYVQQQLGKYGEAQKSYAAFESEGAEHQAYNEVRFRAAETLVQLADAATNRGETNIAAGLLAKAQNKFGEVADVREFGWSDQARFQQATCANRREDYKESARLYEAVTQIPNSSLADRARVYAGRDYLKSGDGDAAGPILEKSVAIQSPYAAEGAHWLAQLYLRAKLNDKAFQIADQWIAKTDDSKIKVPLMMDRADAAYASSARCADSRDLYLEITEKYPQQDLAELALYNAAYAAMETGKFDDAISLAARFEKDFAGGSYLPDVLEVKGDSLLLKEDASAAEKVFADLVDKFDGHPKSAHWRLRRGLASYLQKNYKETISQLDPLIATLPSKAMQAEALHWIGSSHYHLNQAAESIAALEQSYATDAKWRRADETLLTLSRAQYQAGQVAEATDTARKLIDQFPDSPLISEAFYRLGEYAYEAGDFDGACSNYEIVLTKQTDSEFVPFAKFGIGWSQLKKKEFEQAATAFSDLIERYPQHELSLQALVGRASAYRQSNQLDQAVADIQKFLATEPNGKIKVDALYELGLAQIEQKTWPEVAQTFASLVDLASDSPMADRFYYELAWAQRESKQNDQSLANFRALAEKFPESDLAPEANFHLAQDLYTQKKYDDAIRFYDTCFKTCKDQSVKEKAIYKLAWSYYKKGDFAKAHDFFQQQVQQFPDGNLLYADGLFMVSESLFENNQDQQALTAYRVAKPVLETSKKASTNFRLLTLLHGAQVANRVKQYQEAIDFAQPLLSMDIDSTIKQDAYLEIGNAYKGLGDGAESLAAYEKAAMHPGVTGARSRCMIGDYYFGEKKFEDAIDNFKLVGFGYGGQSAPDDVKSWQAFAAYEIARCYYVQIESAKDAALKQKLTDDAIKYFKLLVEKFPNDRLAGQAQEELKKLGG